MHASSSKQLGEDYAATIKVADESCAAKFGVHYKISNPSAPGRAPSSKSAAKISVG